MPEFHEELVPAEHTFDEFGEHWEDECYTCLHSQTVVNSCRCGKCCRSLILEAYVQDAEREPKIKELCQTITGITDELEGYLLNGPEGRCVFLDEQSNLCTIYDTRPLACRLFDCAGEGREQLIELGVIDREG
jgi:Fe-S-cluster containining protein